MTYRLNNICESFIFIPCVWSEHMIQIKERCACDTVTDRDPRSLDRANFVRAVRVRKNDKAVYFVLAPSPTVDLTDLRRVPRVKYGFASVAAIRCLCGTSETDEASRKGKSALSRACLLISHSPTAPLFEVPLFTAHPVRCSWRSGAPTIRTSAPPQCRGATPTAYPFERRQRTRPPLRGPPSRHWP